MMVKLLMCLRRRALCWTTVLHTYAASWKQCTPQRSAVARAAAWQAWLLATQLVAHCLATLSALQLWTRGELQQQLACCAMLLAGTYSPSRIVIMGSAHTRHVTRVCGPDLSLKTKCNGALEGWGMSCCSYATTLLRCCGCCAGEPAGSHCCLHLACCMVLGWAQQAAGSRTPCR